ncbi:MAG: DUF429 domain-containing protein [Rhodomicrobium sp.]
MSVKIAGVDGCRAGWKCVIREVEAPFRETAFIANGISEVLHHPDEPAIIAIDMPIGLADWISGAGRECDIAARRPLGMRASAVFAVPARPAIFESGYLAACAKAKGLSDPPRAMSRQMFNLFPKIIEIDSAMTPALQKRVFECHPEVAFWAMNWQQCLSEPKKLRGRKHPPGLQQRRSLLISHGFSATFLDETKFPNVQAGADDLLDACACSWTAARIYKGAAITFPEQADRDTKGLVMQIFA